MGRMLKSPVLAVSHAGPGVTQVLRGQAGRRQADPRSASAAARDFSREAKAVPAPGAAAVSCGPPATRCRGTERRRQRRRRGGAHAVPGGIGLRGRGGGEGLLLRACSVIAPWGPRCGTKGGVGCQAPLCGTTPTTRVGSRGSSSRVGLLTRGGPSSTTPGLPRGGAEGRVGGGALGGRRRRRRNVAGLPRGREALSPGGGLRVGAWGCSCSPHDRVGRPTRVRAHEAGDGSRPGWREEVRERSHLPPRLRLRRPRHPRRAHRPPSPGGAQPRIPFSTWEGTAAPIQRLLLGVWRGEEVAVGSMQAQVGSLHS